MSEWRYLTMTKTFDEMAERHLHRGLAYVQDGRLDYAAGSFRKYAKFRDRAEGLRVLVELISSPPHLSSNRKDGGGA